MAGSINTSPQRLANPVRTSRQEPEELTPRYSSAMHHQKEQCPLALNRPQPIIRQYSGSLLQASAGGAGKRLGQFDNCNALTTLSNGNLAVIDTHNNRVQLFSGTLEPIRVVGEGKLNSPWGITALAFGKFCVSEGPKRRIVVYTDEGVFVSKFRVNEIEEPCCLATCKVSGNIIVTDYRSPKVCICDLEGHLQQSFKTKPEIEYSDDLPIPEHVATDKSGRIYLSFGHGVSQIQVFNRFGSFEFKFGNFTSAGGLFITAKDNIIVAEREQRNLSLYSTNGQLVQTLVTISNGLQMYPHAVAVVNGGSLAVCAGKEMFGCPNWLHLYKLG